MRIAKRLCFIALAGAAAASITLAQETNDHSAHKDHSSHEQLSAGKVSEYSLFQLDSLWINHEGVPRSLEHALSGKPTVGAMIYTSCEHACPLIVNDMLKIERHLGDDAEQVQFTLFSMDPMVDSPEKLKLYRGDKNLGQWDLYVPNEAGSELELAVALGIRIKPLANGQYAHSNAIFVLDADGTPLYQQNGLGLSPDESVKALQNALR